MRAPVRVGIGSMALSRNVHAALSRFNRPSFVWIVAQALGDVNESDWTRRRGQLKVQLVDVYARLDRGKQKVQA